MGTYHVAKKTKTDGPRLLICEASGREFPYLGYGRPPKFHPDVAKERARARRQKAYDERQRAKGKTVKRKAA
jgi:hypothetical protein